MQTQCPECHTVYRLHLEQIKAAQGQVQCSRCQTIFDAIDQLVPATAPGEAAQQPAETAQRTPLERLDEAPSKEALELGVPATPGVPADTSRQSEPPLDSAEESPAELDLADALLQPDSTHAPEPASYSAEESPAVHEFALDLAKALEQPDDMQLPEPSLDSPPPSSPDDDNELDLDFALTASPPVEAQEPEPIDERVSEAAAVHDLRLDGDTADPVSPAIGELATTPADKTPASPDWDPFSEEHIESLLTAADPGEVEEREGEQDSEEQVWEAAPVSLEAGTAVAMAPAPSQEAEFDEDEVLLSQLLPEDESELEEELARISHPAAPTDAPPSAPPSTDVAEQEPTIPGITPLGETSTSAPPTYSLAPEEAPPPSRGLLGQSLWALGILLLLATLAGQFIYYHQATLATQPQWRPLVAQLCQLTDCELPPQRDLGKIQLASHLVQFHPRFQDSLLITATLINRAEFPQPYPEVELQMTDLQQQIIASRRFKPTEYLLGQRSDHPMPQNIEIPLMLEVLDPGKEVVGFRFEFY